MENSTAVNSFNQTHIGYRNNGLFGGEDHFLVKVLYEEICSMENDDILDYVKSKYNLDYNRAYNPDGTPLFDWDWYQALLAKLNPKFNLPESSTNLGSFYAYWLAPKSGVREFYKDQFEATEITKFKITDPYVILSDLGKEGFLIVTPLPKDDYYADTIMAGCDYN